MSQQELADATEFSRTSIANLETGRQHMTLDGLYTIAETLGVDASVLLPDVDAGTARDAEVARLRRRVAELEALVERYRHFADRLHGLEAH